MRSFSFQFIITSLNEKKMKIQYEQLPLTLSITTKHGLGVKISWYLKYAWVRELSKSKSQPKVKLPSLDVLRLMSVQIHDMFSLERSKIVINCNRHLDKDRIYIPAVSHSNNLFVAHSLPDRHTMSQERIGGDFCNGKIDNCCVQTG